MLEAGDRLDEVLEQAGEELVPVADEPGPELDDGDLALAHSPQLGDDQREQTGLARSPLPFDAEDEALPGGLRRQRLGDAVG